MKKILLSLLCSSVLYADTIGGEVSIGLFNHSPTGSTRYQAIRSVDLSDTLGFSTTQDIFFSAYIEHPLPLLPNLKLSYNTLSDSSNTRVSNLSWGEIQNFTGALSSSLSLRYTDATLYYEVLDNWIEIDVGATLRSLDGDMNLNSTQGKDSVAYATNIPLLYAKARFYIPSTDISFQAELNAISLSSTSSYDYALSARYTFMMGLGLEAGYKVFHLEDNDLVSGLENNIDFTGFYASAIWDF